MFRKHTRRAAKAAFAISFGVALLIGLTACGGGGGSGSTTAPTTTSGSGAKPTIVLGSKNFPEETLLGQLYGQALKAKGFKVVYKPSIGSSELIDVAAKNGKINFYPDYIGIIALDLAKVKNPPATAQATYNAAMTYEGKSGLTLLKMTPFEDVDTFTVLTKTANNLGVKAIGDMKKVAHFSYAGYPECQTRITCLLGLKNIYGLKQVTFKPLSTISVYTLLDNGTVTGGDGFSTDPQQLQTSKYTALTDTKHIFGYQNVAPVVSKKLLSGPNGTLVTSTANGVSALLTLNAMQKMNKAVVVDKQSPAVVAKQFLQANGVG